MSRRVACDDEQSRFNETRIPRALMKNDRSFHAILRMGLADLEPPGTQKIRPSTP
jgi:hypothetical protein